MSYGTFKVENTNLPIFVCGLARCGTSLMMQMLDAAGIPCFGEFPAYEPEEASAANPDRAKLALSLSGKAIKIIDPQRTEWPSRFRAKIIWLDRDRREQAKSQVKFLRNVAGLNIPGQSWRNMASGLLHDRALCSSWWSRCYIAPLFIRFEDLISNPVRIASAISFFAGIKDPHANCRMARQVRSRKTVCAPRMDLEISLMETGALL